MISYDFNGLEWLQDCIQSSADSLKQKIETNPTFAAFLFTILVLLSVPLAMFITFLLVSGIASAGMALLSFLVVEGSAVVFSSGILIVIAGGILFAVSFGFLVFGGTYWLSRKSRSCLIKLKKSEVVQIPIFIAQNVWEGVCSIFVYSEFDSDGIESLSEELHSVEGIESVSVESSPTQHTEMAFDIPVPPFPTR